MADILTRIIGMVAPGLAVKRLKSQYMLKHYMAASRKGPNKGWLPSTQSADNILKSDRKAIVARARDLVRNSSHVAGAINKLVNNIVYTGIHPQAQFRNAKGVLNKSLSDKIEGHWREWAEAVRYYELQRLVLRHWIIDGEVLIMESVNDDLRKQGICPMWPEVLECDYLDESQDRPSSKTQTLIKGGIEFDNMGRPLAYYVLRQHPGEQTGFTMDSVRVSADRIEHIFEPERASQTRGVSKLAPIIMEMRDFAEYQSNERIAARLASAFGVFIESPYPEHSFNHPIQGTDQDIQEAQEAVPKYLESGRIDVLPPGMKISVAENKRPGDNYESYSQVSLRGASAGAGLSYETFSNDYSKATYSSARAATLEERRGYRTIQDMLNIRLNKPVWRDWCKYLDNASIMSVPRIPPVEWQSPGWPWVDPMKDAKAAELELSLGITTRRKLAADRGFDWDDIAAELKAEQDKINDLGLNLTQDNGGNGDEATVADEGDTSPDND